MLVLIEAGSPRTDRSSAALAWHGCARANIAYDPEHIPDEATFVPGRLLVGYRPGTTARERCAVRRKYRLPLVVGFRPDEPYEYVAVPVGSELRMAARLQHE